MTDPLSGPPLAVHLHALAGAGVLGPDALARALELTGRRPTADAWYRFARFQLIILGTVLVVVGAIFFIAANWDIFSPTVRLGLAALAMAGTTLAGGWIGLTKLSGRAAALAGGLLFGPLMALVGQIYQTGADAFDLFLAWSIVLAGYALAVRFAGAWITALLLAVVTAYLYIGQALGSDPFDSPGLWVSLLVAAGLTALALVRRLRRPARADALASVALTIGWLMGFLHGAVAIIMRDWPSGQMLALLVSLAQPLAILLVARRIADPGLARLGVAHLFGLLAVTEGKIIFDTLRLEEPGLLFMGLLLVVQGYLGGRWFMRKGAHESTP